MEDFEKWQTKIELAISKFARYKSEADREDLRQEIALSLITDPDFTSMLSALPEDTVGRYVFVFSKSRILNAYRKNRKHGAAVSLTDPAIAAAVEQSYRPEVDRAKELRSALIKIPALERFIVESLYFEDLTEDTVAGLIGKSKWWVRAKKELALRKLYNLMN